MVRTNLFHNSIKVQWRYCKDRVGFEYKETTTCPTVDFFGFNREVFTDRMCDGVVDCTGGEDETEAMGCQHAQDQSHKSDLNKCKSPQTVI